MLSANQISWLFLGFSGRLSRYAYFLAILLMICPTAIFFYKVATSDANDQSIGIWVTLLYASALGSLWPQAALGAKRIHDLDRPGLYAAILFVPYINFIAFIALCFIPGTPGANSYGQVTNTPAE